MDITQQTKQYHYTCVWTEFDANLQIDLEAKRMDGSSWNKKSIISVFILFFADQVEFTVNGLLLLEYIE